MKYPQDATKDERQKERCRWRGSAQEAVNQSRGSGEQRQRFCALQALCLYECSASSSWDSTCCCCCFFLLLLLCVFLLLLCLFFLLLLLWLLRIFGMFSYTFAAALRKGSGKVGSLPFCCCCCRCCLRATFTAAARHRYTHVHAHTHTHVTKRNEVGVRTNTRAANTLVHKLTSFRIISCTFLQSLLSCVSMRTFALCLHVYVYLYVCLCVSTEFLCWRLSYSYSALFPQFVCRQKCIHN